MLDILKCTNVLKNPKKDHIIKKNMYNMQFNM